MSLDTDTQLDVFPCPVCQSPVFDDELYCEVCGGAVATQEETGGDQGDREERDLRGMAGISDRGRRRSRNEDAMAIAAANGRFLAVVCDGVASTANGDQAARAAADATLTSLEPLLRMPDWPEGDALEAFFDAAFREAQSAVMLVPDEEPEGSDLSPSTTLVSALASPDKIVIGNVGDSRAYWLARTGGGKTLSVDDSLAQESIAQGVAPEVAFADPDAHTITRWIGGDTDSVSPRTKTFDVTEPGVLVLCTDGLWNYFEEPDRLHRLLEGRGHTAIDMARRLVDAALAAGGLDNVTVVVVPIGVDSDRTTPRGGRPSS
ncbi:MAG TPA: PP2C family serine/threonine-protein phosphatase [Acidimicrobiales bacterium]|jgi:serine/threonine protein phosphatase PrpC